VLPVALEDPHVKCLLSAGCMIVSASCQFTADGEDPLTVRRDVCLLILFDDGDADVVLND